MFSAVDTIWVLFAAALVFFMQAGFAMVETGFTRAKNAGNIIMKNLMDFALGSLVFWVFGFGLIFGPSLGGIIGMPDFFVRNNYDSTFPTAAFFIFQTVFCATAATIVSGAMAERTKFISYCIYSVAISAFVYPVSAHWIWGGGFLSQLGFHDFAGSTAVHMVGGVSALIGAKLLGPRIGKYSKHGKSRAIPGHSLTLGALGVFILWFCWFGFNGGSTTSMTGEAIVTASSAFVTTNLAAAAAATVTMIITWVKYKKPDVSMTLNGVLGGLVAVTAGADVVTPAGAVIIGLIAGVVMEAAIVFIDTKIKIDDPVGAIGVHGVCGALGTLLVGLFAKDGGLFYGGGWQLLGVQALGVVIVIAWVTVMMIVIFGLLKKTVGLRVAEEEEILGLDSTEHGLASSYADFAPAVPVMAAGVSVKGTSLAGGAMPGASIQAGHTEHREHTEQVMPAMAAMPTVPVEAAIPVTVQHTTGVKTKFTKVSIVTRPSKLEDLKAALETIGITGLTVTQVLGAGMQKGYTKYYRGVEMDIHLLPKVRIEVVVCKIPVETVIEAVKKALYTGEYGDGKIFVYDVEDVIRVRTGETGYDALQDECDVG